MLDLYPTGQQDVEAQAANTPAPTSGSTYSDSFDAAWDANKHFGSIMANRTNLADAAQEHLDNYEARTGEKLPNPYRLGYNPLAWDAGSMYDNLKRVRDATGKAAATLNDPSLAFPDGDTLQSKADEIGRKSLSNQARVSQNAQGLGATAGGVVGDLASIFQDPATLALNGMAMAAAPEGGLVRALLGSAATFGAQGAVQEGLTFANKQRINPDWTLGDAAQSVGEQALFGAVMEGGTRGIGALARRMLGMPAAAHAVVTGEQQAAADAARLTGAQSVPPVESGLAMPTTLPPDLRDAANAAERKADLAGNNPFKTGADGIGPHAEGIAHVEDAMVRDQPLPELAGADAQGAVRTGDVFVPPQPSPLDIVDRHAWSLSPKLFERVNDLDQQLAGARAEIARIASPDDDGEAGSGIANRLAGLQEELAGYTGKRRSSPGAKALRAQIDGLQQQSDALTAGASERDAARTQLLRERIVDLEGRRGELGPKVRAVRQHAAQMLGIPLDAGIELDHAPSASGRPYHAPEPKEVAPAPAKPLTGKQAYEAKKTAKKAVKEPKAAEPPASKYLPPVEQPPAPTPAEVTGAQRAAANGEQNAYVGRKAVRVKYELAEADDLVTSHDRDFRENPAFPQELQPRDRSGVAARDQVHSIAADLNPERLGPSVEGNSGAPIVGPDNIVESGNGRTMAIRMAYDQNPARAASYRSMLDRMGYDSTGMKNPVLVARRVSNMDAGEREAFVHAANGSAALRMSATEMALSDARHMTADVTGLYVKGSDVRSLANRDFVRAFVAKMPAGERGGMLTANGDLSAGGVNRVKAALAARAYGDPGFIARAFDHADSNIKTLASALIDAAGSWAQMRDAVSAGEIASAKDITDDVMTALKAIMRARDEGRPVGEVLAQSDMFASDQSSLAARLFFKNDFGAFQKFLSKADMAENLNTFARNMLEQLGKGDDMFGSAPPSTGEVLAGTVRKSDERVAQVEAAGLREAPDDAGSLLSGMTAGEKQDMLSGFLKAAEDRKQITKFQAQVAVRKAEDELAKAKDSLAKFGGEGTPARIAAAEAKLVEAKAAEQDAIARFKSEMAADNAKRRALAHAKLTPDSVEKGWTDPKVHEAMEASMIRDMEQGKNRVPVERGDGSMELGFVDKELHDANAQLDLANEIQSCAIPAKEAAE